MALCSNILTFLIYCAAIGAYGWEAFQTNHSWRAAGIASAQMLGGFLVVLLIFDAVMNSAYSPKGRIRQWLERRRSR